MEDEINLQGSFWNWLQIFHHLQSWAVSTCEVMEPDFAMWKEIHSISFPYIAQVLKPFLICIWSYMSPI